jgi:hypothetical protein
MADQGFATPAIEQQAIMNARLSFKVKLIGNTTAASVTAGTTANDGIRVWLEAASLSAPTNANFSGLQSSATPTVIGIYIEDGHAIRLGGVTVPVNSIRSASMTAGVITNTGETSAISGSTGVTDDGNLAFQVSCTGLDVNAAAIDHEFNVEVTYDRLG